TFDGRLHLLVDTDYNEISREKTSFMPPLQAAPEERRDLLAYLSTLGGVPLGPLATETDPIPGEVIEGILNPKPADWPTYNGNLNGNRYSTLDQINTGNVSRLQLQWTYAIPHPDLELTPLVVEGVMYV